MDEKTLFNILELYQRERHHETLKFGDYKKIKSLNFASFLLLIEEYVLRAKKAYTGKWSDELPPWLKNCAEYELHETAPIEAYAEVIKIMALAGAALETFAKIDPDKWRPYLE